MDAKKPKVPIEYRNPPLLIDLCINVVRPRVHQCENLRGNLLTLQAVTFRFTTPYSKKDLSLELKNDSNHRRIRQKFRRLCGNPHFQIIN
jgi:hypothetical protein